MKFNKLKDDSGSAMLFVIFLMALVSIIMLSFSVQVGNQVNSTINSNESIQEKYKIESYIEEAIADFIESIDLTLKEDIVKYPTETKYFYYDINYQIPSDIKEEIGHNEKRVIEFEVEQIKPKESTNNPLKIFSHISPEDKEMNMDEFNGTKKETITFSLNVTERNNEDIEKDDVKSKININLSNISGKKGKEKCDINYEVIYWRVNS